ncbi:helix-turn-helix domain-containing protein [Streptomyces thermolineatus]|uniref:Helix-turn-helix domain-containing protein n=1 Tax=Streptomyces thermolineatus TaxID=44033 RepID=A0ABN3MGD4_9ACTN
MSIGTPPPDDPPSVGRALAQARAAAGLTVGEISARTRVRVPIVQAIEQDDYSRCGGDVYARGHIRTLAREVGLDPAPLVEAFDAEHGGRTAPAPAAKVFDAERIRSEPRRPNWTAAMVAAIAAVVMFVGFTLFSGEDRGATTPAAGKPSAAPPTTDGPGRTPSAEPEQSGSAIAAAPADKVTVKLTAAEDQSWISVVDSTGRTLFQNVLTEGQSETFTDNEQLKLVIGNAGAVRMFVNGKDLGPAGDGGQVVRLNFTPGDPEAG